MRDKHTPRVLVRHLEKYYSGWSWIVCVDDQWTDFHRTNRNGYGLFAVGDYGNVRQILGTGQFSLFRCSRSAAYGRIRRYYQKRYGG